MKKVAIITLYGNNNFGNKLQNYALQEKLQKLGVQVNTLKNYTYLNDKKELIKRLILKMISKRKKCKNKKEYRREKYFEIFNEYINYDKKTINVFNTKEFKYDFYIVGSDQVWNPNFWSFSDIERLSFATSEKRISYAASFGVEKLDLSLEKNGRKDLLKFKAISVREDRGKEIVEELTGRKDVEVLVDPTMLLTSEEWDKVSKKPTMLKTDKYILNYFLGELSEERKNEIERIAKENNCEIINILDKNSPFYECGPSEFLYLEKNAFLICTDSFHSSVFAILYNRPFIIFDREQKNLVSMNSRLETLIKKFKLKDRKFEGKITDKNLQHDYTEAYKILEEERKKSDKFLKKALDINE